MGLYENTIPITETALLEQFLDEAYFGKTPILLEIEKAIHDLRNSPNLKKYKDLDALPEVQRINRLFEKQFGMEIFALKIIPSKTINAYTIPVATRFDVAMNINMKNMVEATQSTGYRFVKNNHLCIECFLHLGLLQLETLTDGEIVSTILHELGHNFTDAVYKKIRVDNRANAVFWYKHRVLITIMNIFKFRFREVSYMNKNYNYKNARIARRDQKRYNPLRGLIRGIKGSASDFKSFVKSVFFRVFKSGYAEEYMRDASIYTNKKDARRSYGRRDEVIADKICGIYGYGPEQASALLKMDKYKSDAEKYVDRLPGGKEKNRRINNAYRRANDYDEHPNDIQRIREEIKVLQYELDRGCDPKYAAMIKGQIAELENTIKDAITVMKEYDQDQRAQAMFNAYINNKEPDAIDEDLENEINDALEAIVDRSKE